MQPRLVAYCTNAGSTEAVAAVVAEELGKDGVPTDVRRTDAISELGAYGAVVVGGPIIFSQWHRAAVDFVTRHEDVLRQVPLAFFMTALHLVRTPGRVRVPIWCDPTLATDPRRPERLGFTERYSTVERYLAPVLGRAPLVKPLSVAFFGGKMDHRKLRLPHRLFAQLLIRKPGDFRNWPAIRAWAGELRHAFLQGG